MPVDADRTGQQSFAQQATGVDDMEGFIEQGPDGQIPISADTPQGIVDDLADAANKLAFGDFEGRNEEELFNSQYTGIKQQVKREQGLTALALYNRYEPLVKAATLHISDEENDSFGGKIASGDQFLVKQIDTQTFADNTNGQGPDPAVGPGDRVFSTGGTTDAAGTSAFGIVPREAAGSFSSGDNYGTLTGQILIITHYVETTNGRVIESVQDRVTTDNHGQRSPSPIYDVVNRGNEGVIPRDGALVVDHDNEGYQCLGRALSNAETDIMPQGVEITQFNNLPTLSA